MMQAVLGQQSVALSKPCAMTVYKLRILYDANILNNELYLDHLHEGYSHSNFICY